MANMSYCRFQNTLKDLRDCNRNFTSVESIEEAKAARDLYSLCQQIVDAYDLDELTEQVTELQEEDAALDED